jgi:DNA ligase-1
MKEVYDLLLKIASVSARKEKIKIIKNYKNTKWFKETVIYAYDYRKVFNIKQFFDDVADFTQAMKPEYIFEFLDKLASQNGASNQDINYLHSLCNDRYTVEVVKRILNGDLRCGVAIKTWKEIFPEIEEHSPMLCSYAVRYSHRYKTYNDVLDRFVSLCGGWNNIIGSLKANGVRVWVDTSVSPMKYVSRSGKLYPNFNCLDEECLKIAKKLKEECELDYMPTLDGEIIIEGEDFQDQMKQVRRLEDVDDSKFRFILFDSPSLGGRTQFSRSIVLNDCVTSSPLEKITFVNEVIFDDFEDFHSYFIDVLSNGYEGLVLKYVSAPYEFKRSNAWCKVKDFYSVDLKVVGVEKGTGKYKNMLGALLVDFNGVTVKVGSGFSDQQREWFLENPPKIVEVEYKMVTKDGSLQFPTFVKERDDLL